jgi:hypothetical protein
MKDVKVYIEKKEDKDPSTGEKRVYFVVKKTENTIDYLPQQELGVDDVKALLAQKRTKVIVQ